MKMHANLHYILCITQAWPKMNKIRCEKYKTKLVLNRKIRAW